MADYFSDHYSATASSNTIDDPRIKVAAGLSNAKIRYKRGVVTTDTDQAAADVLRFFTLKSSDRILELLLTTPGDGGTTVTTDLGVHTKDGGAAIDANLFATAVDINAAVARVDQFVEAGTLEQADRGKPLYVLVDEGLASAVYDNDPLVDWDITGTISTENATAGAEVVLEVYYTSAGA